MQVSHIGPSPPRDLRGQIFVSEGIWTQSHLTADAPTRRNAPYSGSNLALPYQTKGLVGLYCESNKAVVMFDLDLADDRSLDSLAIFLETAPESMNIVLEVYKDGWWSEPALLPTVAAKRLGTLRCYRGVDLAGRAFVHQSARAIPSLDRAFTHWQNDRASPDLKNLAVTTERFDGGFRFGSIGADSLARRFFGDAWSAEAIGRPLEIASANREYDEAVLAAYQRVFESQMPQRDKVIASVQRGDRREWTAYERLMIPLGPATLASVVSAVPFDDALGFLRR